MYKETDRQRMRECEERGVKRTYSQTKRGEQRGGERKMQQDKDKKQRKRKIETDKER